MKTEGPSSISICIVAIADFKFIFGLAWTVSFCLYPPKDLNKHLTSLHLTVLNWTLRWAQMTSERISGALWAFDTIHLLLLLGFELAFNRCSILVYSKPSKKQLVLITLTTLTVVSAIAFAVVITLYCFKTRHHFHGKPKSSANAELYQNGAVATDAASCSELGMYCI